MTRTMAQARDTAQTLPPTVPPTAAFVINLLRAQ